MAYYLRPDNTKVYIFEPTHSMTKPNPYSNPSTWSIGTHIENDTIYFSEYFVGSIERYYKVLDHVSKIIFVSIKNLKDLHTFLPRANITYLSFNGEITHEIVLTRYITYFKFTNYPDKQFVLNSRIKYLTLGDVFNQILTINKNIIVLRIGYYFNQLLKLNKTMHYLSLGNLFDQPFNSGLSKNISHLILGNKFNKHIQLPKNLFCLSMGWNFKQPTVLSPYIIYFSFCVWSEKQYYTTKHSNGKLHISLPYDTHNYLDNLPNGIKHVDAEHCIVKYLNNMPNDLKTTICSDGHRFCTLFKYDSSEVYFKYYM